MKVSPRGLRCIDINILDRDIQNIVGIMRALLKHLDRVMTFKIACVFVYKSDQGSNQVNEPKPCSSEKRFPRFFLCAALLKTDQARAWHERVT